MEEQCGLSAANPTQKKHRLNVLPPNIDTSHLSSGASLGRFPSWLHRPMPQGDGLKHLSSVIENNRLHTVCEEARCPNLLECWSKRTATFLVMGKTCTRNCGFCEIDFSKNPPILDENEPERVADSVKILQLRHVVITMVARDDLKDGGALHLSQVIHAIRLKNPGVTVEVLTSDFNGNLNALDIIIEASPAVFNHNIETTKALTAQVRHTATYDRSLQILNHVRLKRTSDTMLIKSGMMLGLGETQKDVEESLRDLKSVGCDIVTMGQYLQPSRKKLLVKSFIHPDMFKQYELYGLSIGLKHMYCGPLIRSSYNADLFMNKS